MDIKLDGGYPQITIIQFCITWSVLSNESPKKYINKYKTVLPHQYQLPLLHHHQCRQIGFHLHHHRLQIWLCRWPWLWNEKREVIITLILSCNEAVVWPCVKEQNNSWNGENMPATYQHVTSLTTYRYICSFNSLKSLHNKRKWMRAHE